MGQTVYMAASESEAAHHVASFARELCLRCLEPERVSEVARPGDLVIFFSEHFDRFRDCCRVVQERNVATLYLIDGILEWRNAWENRDDEPACPWTMRPILSHKAACIGFSQARQLAAWGNGKKLEIVGVPRFDRLRNVSGCKRESKKFRVLVATAKCPGFTSEQMETTRRSLRDLRDEMPRVAPDGREIEIVWRLTGGLADSIGVVNSNQSLADGKGLVEQLQAVDAMITTPSTVALEGMLLNLPVALLDYHLSPCMTPTAWTIHCREQIVPVITELAHPPEPKFQHQQYLLRDHLYLAEPATKRMLELVQGMMELAQQSCHQGRRLEYQGPILAPPQSESIEFDHSRIYANFPDFLSRDTLLLQTELAHSRREINQLTQQLRQAKAELSEAHQIFEEIHRHPIAGPIVRIRQLVLEKLQSWRNGNSVESSKSKSINSQSK